MERKWDQALAARIEHTLLKPETTAAQIEQLCAEAREYQFHGVCVNGTWVGLAARLLEGFDRAIVATVGFPLGAMTTAAKGQEAYAAIYEGATELDMVINLGELKDGNDVAVETDIRAVVDQAGEQFRVKVILETGLLTPQEIVRACKITMDAGADFVKTSSGFGPRGASEEDVRLLRQTVGKDFGVKAAGGIRTRAQALALIEAGADRIGTSHSVAIATQAE